MILQTKQILNTGLILFVLMFTLNCAEEKNENKSSEITSENTLKDDSADTLITNIDPSIRQSDETPEEYQFRVAGKNNVKSRITTNYLYDLKGNLMENGAVSEKVYFDKQGRRVEHIIYRGTNLVDKTWKFSYDSNNNLTEYLTYDDMNRLALKKNMKYDDKNNLIERIETYPLLNREIVYNFKYNDNRKLVETKASSSDGKQTIEKREYTEFGKVKRVIITDNNGNVAAESNYQYNKSGNLTSETIKSAGKPEQVITYGNYSYIYPQEVNYPISKKEYKYSDSGELLLDVMYNSGGGRQYKFVIEYDEKGLIKQRTRYDGKDNPALIMKYSYEFHK